MKEKVTIKNIWYYIQGTLRYRVYYTNWNFLIRSHILEQIHARINSMDKKCYDDGQCHMCGCTTTALQMADKPCNKPCYPVMLSAKVWAALKNNGILYDPNIKDAWVLDIEGLKFRKL